MKHKSKYVVSSYRT